jgi:hypothetical protein
VNLSHPMRLLRSSADRCRPEKFAAAEKSEPEGEGAAWKAKKRRKNTQAPNSCSRQVQSRIRFLEAGPELGGDGHAATCKVWVCGSDRWLPCVETEERKIAVDSAD